MLTFPLRCVAEVGRGGGVTCDLTPDLSEGAGVDIAARSVVI